ncbi:MAG TPA: sulfotransferase [Acidimicrobiales bacterium]|nr:sulfotransferase [Acidimicrobiales bacterium]
MVRGRRFDATAWLAANAPAPVDAVAFRLTDTEIRHSSVGHRMTVVWGDPGRAGALRRYLGSRLNVLDPPTGLLSAGVLRIWTDYQWVTHMGPAVMAQPRDFLVALRTLTDALLSAAAPGTGHFGEMMAPDPLARTLVSSLYPEAVQVELDDVGLDGLAAAASPCAGDNAKSQETVGPSPAAVTVEPDAGESPDLPAPELLFVLGSARSGTTWLAGSLQAHPGVGGIGEAESWLFEMLAPLWQLAQDDGALGAHVAVSQTIEAVRRFCDRLFAAALRRNAPNAHLFVEKTPGHIRHLAMLAAVYPDARYVHLLRDGRAVARSLSGMAMAGHPDPGRAAAGWSDAVRTVRSGSHLLPQLREVRYEALTADAVTEVTAVLEWAGCPVDDVTRAAIADKVGHRVSDLSFPAGAPGSESWRSLSPWALARVYASAGAVLAAEGYVSAGELRAWRRRPSYVVARLLRPRRLAATDTSPSNRAALSA